MVAPISLSTTYKQDRPGEPKGHDYSRAGNPSRDVLQKCLAALEDGKHCKPLVLLSLFLSLLIVARTIESVVF